MMCWKGVALFGKMTASTLLKSEMHAPEKGSANEGDFVDDEKGYRTPLFLKALCGVTFDFFFPATPSDLEA